MNFDEKNGRRLNGIDQSRCPAGPGEIMAVSISSGPMLPFVAPKPVGELGALRACPTESVTLLVHLLAAEASMRSL